jgi:hypothetical protein
LGVIDGNRNFVHEKHRHQVDHLRADRTVLQGLSVQYTRADRQSNFGKALEWDILAQEASHDEIERGQQIAVRGDDRDGVLRCPRFQRLEVFANEVEPTEALPFGITDEIESTVSHSLIDEDLRALSEARILNYLLFVGKIVIEL